MHPLLAKFEKDLELNVTDAAKLLGVHRVSYYQMRTRTTLLASVKRSVEIILSLPKVEKDRLIRKYVGEPDDEL